jgi:high-affinity iron transporter
MMVRNGWKRYLDAKTGFTILGAALVLGVMIWQAVTAYGVPDPSAKNLSPAAVVLSSSVLVFREGLEAILVLAAVTAGLVRNRQEYWRAVAAGAGAAFLATIATWFAVIAIISAVNAPELAVQAGTGLLAILVLLVVMNWFFHKMYWTGWIAHHGERRRRVLEGAAEGGGTFFGLALLGFTAIYREGFEIVLFLQDLRLKAGTGVVLYGAGIGLALTLIVAALTFIANQRLPYKRMLILTGVLLGLVLIVMVGEEVQEMQLAGWLATTALPLSLPGWLGMWFAVFPNVQGLVAQALAACFVIGSYVAARKTGGRSRPQTAAPSERPAQQQTPAARAAGE